jgi:hypothetical protein
MGGTPRGAQAARPVTSLGSTRVGTLTMGTGLTSLVWVTVESHGTAAGSRNLLLLVGPVGRPSPAAATAAGLSPPR